MATAVLLSLSTAQQSKSLRQACRLWLWGQPRAGASDVAALLAAVGGEQIQYIEFNSVRRELEARQRWPLLHLVSELLDQPERPADIAKPVVLHEDGVAI